MLNIPHNVRLFLCHHPMNMRKSFEGLSLEVEKLFPGEVLSGALFIFVNRRKNHMKILTWDQDGFVIWFKRLEKGSFRVNWGEPSLLTRKEFFLVLEGITPKRLNKRFSL